MIAFYYLFLATAWFISLLPFKLLYIFSDFLYLIAYYVIGYRKKVVINNLKNAFPEKSDKEIELTAKEFYRNFCDIIVETLKTLTITEKQLRERMKYKPPSGSPPPAPPEGGREPTLKNPNPPRGERANLVRQANDQKPLISKEGGEPTPWNSLSANNTSFIAVQGHYCNWEWTVMMGPEFANYKHYAIYQPLSNKFFDRLMCNLRSKFGTIMIPMKSAYKTMLKNKNEPGFYQFGADQTPPQHSEFWTSFLNQDTPVFLGIEKIAKAVDIPVVFINVQRVKRGYYEIEFIKLFDNPKETDQYEITEKHVRTLEEIIRTRPGNWLWSHRRWKHSAPPRSRTQTVCGKSQLSKNPSSVNPV